MVVYDDIFEWKGWGGALKLAGGKCYLRIYDLRKYPKEDLIHLKSTIVLVTDFSPDPPCTGEVTIRSCAGHIATSIVKQFKINPARMLYVEYFPKLTYGKKKEFTIGERFDAVDFTWRGQVAMKPKWRTIEAPFLGQLKALIKP